MRRMADFAAFVAALFLGGFLVETAAAEERAFTLGSIEGSWGFSGDGVLAAPDPADRLPIAGIGVVRFDGHGGCEIAGTNNLNGQSLEAVSEACSYEVNPDGTGTSLASFPASGPLPAVEVPVSFVIVDGGRELRLIQSAVVVSSFVAKRVDRPRGRIRR